MSEKQLPMMISLTREARDRLRTLAAEQNLRNPARVVTAAGLARELILEGIERIEQMEMKLACEPVNEKGIGEVGRCQTGVRTF